MKGAEKPIRSSRFDFSASFQGSNESIKTPATLGRAERAQARRGTRCLRGCIDDGVTSQDQRS